MKISSQAGNRSNKGFTLIEMIGVLAVIAILAAVLIPKVFQAINDSRVNNAAMSCQTVKTAIIDHFAKFGSLLSSNGIPFAVGAGKALVFDKVLVSEAFLDKPFATKIGDATANTTVRVDAAEAATANPIAATPVAVAAGMAAYNLDGTGTAGTDYNKAIGSAVVHAIITGVTLNDARDLNSRIDGTSAALGEGSGLTGASVTAGTESDVSGRVKYTFAAAGGTATVYVYLTHR